MIGIFWILLIAGLSGAYKEIPTKTEVCISQCLKDFEKRDSNE